MDGLPSLNRYFECKLNHRSDCRCTIVVTDVEKGFAAWNDKEATKKATYEYWWRAPGPDDMTENIREWGPTLWINFTPSPPPVLEITAVRYNIVTTKNGELCQVPTIIISPATGCVAPYPKCRKSWKYDNDRCKICHRLKEKCIELQEERNKHV